MTQTLTAAEVLERAAEPLDTGKLRELLAKATPGEWSWYGNTKTNSIYLATVKGGRRYVMGFERWGMRGAQPTFQVNSRMVPASELVRYDVDPSVQGVTAARAAESVYREDFSEIDAPDAALIVAAVNALPSLLDRAEAADKLEKQVEDLRRLEKSADDLAWDRAAKLSAAEARADALAGRTKALLTGCYAAMRDAAKLIDPEEGPGREHSDALTALAKARVQIEQWNEDLRTRQALGARDGE